MPVSPPASDPWSKPPEITTAAPEGSVTVTQQTVHFAVLWGLQSVDLETVTTVTRMLGECHGRLQPKMHWKIQTLIANVLLAAYPNVAEARQDPIYKLWDGVLGKMLTLDMKRGR